MKRTLAILLASILALTMAACSGNASSPAGDAANPPSGNNTQTPPNTSEPSAPTDEIYEVVMQYPTLGVTPTDLQKVEDAINAKVTPAIGVKVTLFPVVVFDLNNTTNLMVSTGEKLDVISSMFEGGVGSYVNKGALIELDDLVEQYGQDIVAAEGIAMNGGYFNGKLYAVPTEEKMGRVKSFMARKDLLDKYNISYDPNHIYTYDELTDIFATVKSGEGANFYCIAANAGEDPPFYATDPVDFLGATLASGCLPNYGVGSDTITNYYETDGFKNAVKYAREWYQKGYYSPDVNTTPDASYINLFGGNFFGMWSNSEPDMVANMGQGAMDNIGTGLVALYTTAPAAMTQYYQQTLWAIPVTCKNPEKTMQWLNMMYADKDIINLLYRGIEGEHYEFAEGSEWVINFPEGIDGSNTPYICYLNVWGDKMKDYVMPPLDESYYQQMRDFNNSVDAAHTSAALGYCFNSDPVKTEAAAVADVIGRYQASLALGVVDPEAVLPEFQNALKTAGIDKIIAENQKQYDSWRAGR